MLNKIVGINSNTKSKNSNEVKNIPNLTKKIKENNILVTITIKIVLIESTKPLIPDQTQQQQQ